MIKARVVVFLKADVMDPQGEAVGHALGSLGHKGVKKVRVGRAFDLELDEADAEKAEAEVKKMCESLLANMVIEKYEITLNQVEGCVR
jgi:phosphoribosylformylglycinamidine synthase subunit PurS